MKKTRISKFNTECPECGCEAVVEVEVYDEEYVEPLMDTFNSQQHINTEVTALLRRARVELKHGEYNQCKNSIHEAELKLSVV